MIEQKIKSFEDVWNCFRSRASHEGSRWLFNKIKNGCRFANIPTVPENFFDRINGVKKSERFEHKNGRRIVYPRNSSEAFEYRWIDDQLVIVDTANLLINVSPLLVWYPFINKRRSIKPTCYAVVEQKTAKWFAGEWVSLLSGIRLYALSGHWTNEFQDLVLLDKDGNRRQTHKDIVRVFKDDNGEIMCSLCDLAFASQDSYQLHAGLHDQGWPHIRHCCLRTLTTVKPSQEPHFCLQHQTAEAGPIKTIVDRHTHSFFRKVMDFKRSLNHTTNIAHNWDLIAYSVRWSSANPSAKSGQFSSDLEQLVEAYEHSYKPTFKKVIKSPLSPRSSRCPIFVQLNVVRPSITDDFFGQIHGMEQSSRILILSQSMEGLTTNLQSLVFFARSMEHLHITLGFCLLRPDRLLDFGQEVKGGKGWVFYDLQTLRNNINGVATDPRYMRLVKALFFIQKRKQE